MFIAPGECGNGKEAHLNLQARSAILFASLFQLCILETGDTEDTLHFLVLLI